MSITTNNAAWLTAAKAHPFEVKEAPVWKPDVREILIRNHAVAVNPVDGSLQSKAWWPLEYPTMLGQDVAGQVIAVGEQVTRFQPGDRVVGHAVDMATPTVSYENAAMIPLGFSTAAAGLFQSEFLRLNLPTEPRALSTGKTLLLGVAAGYDVITTSSPKNFVYARRLGASEVFDYHDAAVEENLVRALHGKTLAGIMDCIKFSPTPVCLEIVRRCEGDKAVATVKGGFTMPPEGIRVKNVFGTSIKDNAVGPALYESFLPAALASGVFRPAPEPLVVGTGLETVQAAVDLQVKGGNSAQMVVVLL
ncbi:putative glucose-repressible alcohol dehydrogenase [Aspergillus steynii IBT 23096]|uniref:Putative glucose-repressible alcohol dehydrogenase n=1 Tax=Aspergillus steynii IBT 23096 TaxID=1392250 RepID=A0A2I2GES2_9EURO|nr:putative glucose-repressible alcohol dehydrogenase [Aspergillus steynii IBT 23096]PLB51388.1 putative glucose-repressible alcohol dehydrogenase [Aspergillus steynii IBT 23096]